MIACSEFGGLVKETLVHVGFACCIVSCACLSVTDEHL